MHQFDNRHQLLATFARSIFLRTFLVLWTLLGAYDLFLSQLIPEEWSRHFPKAIHAILVGRLLPWWAWVIALAIIIALCSLEFAFRISSEYKTVFANSTELMTSSNVEPDVPATAGFEEILEHGSWAHDLRGNDPELSRERIVELLDAKIHDFLRLGKMHAWGKPSKQHRSGLGPIEEIPKEKWADIEIVFNTRRNFGDTAKFRQGHRQIPYFDIHFSKVELRALFPLLSTQSIKAITRSKLEWNFEIYGPFIGMSAGPEQQILIHNFQARGWNRTGAPIEKVNAYVRSDITNKKYPTTFNLFGSFASAEELNAIPVNAIIDTFTPFSSDKKPISMKTFLNEIGPFTFVFEFDGEKVQRSFTLEEIEPRIQNYQQIVRKKLIPTPRVTRKS